MSSDNGLSVSQDRAQFSGLTFSKGKVVGMGKACVILAAVSLLLAASAAHSGTIAEALSSPQWMQVTVEGIVTYLEPDECYIEDPGRSGGIWVLGPTDGIELGDPVIAFGTFSVVSGEPAVLDASIYLHGKPFPVQPFGMANRDIGGASRWSPMWIWDYRQFKVLDGHQWTWMRDWAHACGASNTGLLVRTWGVVRSVYHSAVNGAKWIYIDDGSGTVSDYGDTGVLVYSDAEIEQDDTVSVTGISSTEPSYDDPARLIRVVRTRDVGDVVVLQPRPIPPQLYPFSDEFDSPMLDPRWYASAGDGTLSLTEMPGWLTITPPMPHEPAHSPPYIMQFVPGNWNMELKLMAQRSTDRMVNDQVFLAQMTPGDAPMTIGWPAGVFGARFNSSSTSVSIGRKDIGSVGVGPLWFRLRWSWGVVYGSVSTDGVEYIPQPELRVYTSPVLTLAALLSMSYGTWPPRDFKVYIDYIRFTSVQQGGEQQ